jgi:uncharacterized phage infection (PIP) family protein YhgE
MTWMDRVWSYLPPTPRVRRLEEQLETLLDATNDDLRLATMRAHQQAIEQVTTEMRALSATVTTVEEGFNALDTGFCKLDTRMEEVESLDGRIDDIVSTGVEDYPPTELDTRIDDMSSAIEDVKSGDFDTTRIVESIKEAVGDNIKSDVADAIEGAVEALR